MQLSTLTRLLTYVAATDGMSVIMLSRPATWPLQCGREVSVFNIQLVSVII